MHTKENGFSFKHFQQGTENVICSPGKKKSTTKIKTSIFTMPFFPSIVAIKNTRLRTRGLTGRAECLEGTAADGIFCLSFLLLSPESVIPQQKTEVPHLAQSLP